MRNSENEIFQPLRESVPTTLDIPRPDVPTFWIYPENGLVKVPMAAEHEAAYE